MKLLVFAVYDKAVSAFMQPFFARSKGEAVRSFTEACNDEKHNFHKHASDYSLMFMGEFDDNSGLYSTADPTRIIGAYECLVDDVFPPEAEVKGPKRLPM